MKKGITLIEFIIAAVMLFILAGVAIFTFRAVLLSWSGQETRAGLDIDLNAGIEEIRRDLMQAKDVDDSVNDDELRFTTLSDSYYIYYLYNEDDDYPQDFDQVSYELRKTELDDVVDGDLTVGTFSYGDGMLIIEDILPPDTSDLSFDGDVATIDLSSNRGDETTRLRTEVKPRNLGL